MKRVGTTVHPRSWWADELFQAGPLAHACFRARRYRYWFSQELSEEWARLIDPDGVLDDTSVDHSSLEDKGPIGGAAVDDMLASMTKCVPACPPCLPAHAKQIECAQTHAPLSLKCLVAGKCRRYGMAPVHITGICLSQKPSIKNGVTRPAMLFLAWLLDWQPPAMSRSCSRWRSYPSRPPPSLHPPQFLGPG